MPNEEKRQDESDARSVAESIVRRERWRVRLWAAATAGLWVVTAAYLLILVFTYMLLLHPAVNEFVTGGEMNDRAREDFAAAIIDWLWALLWWPITLVVAAAGSIWFTLASRRATLRQIQASLAQISDQLKQMVPEPSVGSADPTSSTGAAV
ncbi:MAG: hypothetical protein ACYSUF_05185 [Planctomycetota bacterium]|jgi:hypothetical protein